MSFQSSYILIVPLTCRRFTPEKTYANVSRRGVSPSPTRSPATTSVSPISVPGSFEPIRIHGRTQSMINLNRSRGGSNIAMNGVALRAQLPSPNLKTRRSFDRYAILVFLSCIQSFIAEFFFITVQLLVQAFIPSSFLVANIKT